MPEQLEELQPAQSVSPAESRVLSDSLARPFPPDPHAPRPTASEPPASRRRGRTLLALAIGLMLGIFIAALVSFALSLLFHGHTQLDTSSPAVVEQIRKLSRLETVDYSIDKIVEGQRQYALLPNFLTGDKLLLIAHGEVIAGVDLSQLRSSDISVNGQSVTVHLPQAQILSARLDNQRTRVYSRDTGLLATADPALESTVRQAAEQQITQAAITDGILNKARQNAQTSVTALLYGLGFHSVTVN